MLKVFQATDKTYSTNGNIVLKPTIANVHKEDNGDFYLDLETIFDEKEVKIQPEAGTIVSSQDASLTITDANTLKEVELTKIDGNTTQSGTPTPTSPQPINVVSGRQEVVVCGKNLFNKNTVSTGFLSENGTITSNNDYRTSDFIPIKPNTAYYKTLTLSPRTKFYDSNKQPLNTTTYQDISIGGNAGTFTTPNNAYYLRFTINITTASVSVDTVMLNEGSTATEYEEYKGQSYEINLGKQLLDLKNGTYTATNGITATVENGEITLNGTSTGIGFVQIDLNTRYNLEKNIPYTVSANNSVANADVRIRLDNNGNLDTTLSSINASRTITYNNETLLYTKVAIRVASGITLTNYKFRPMLEKGNISTPYAPYKIPIELCKIGTAQDFIKKGTGKNLINPNSAYTGTSNGITTTYNENQSLSFSGTTTGTWFYLTNKININLPSGDYTFLINKAVSNHTVIIRMFYNETQYQDITINKNTTSRTVNVSNDTIAYQIYCGGTTSGTAINDTLYFQLEKGNATSYEPYGMYNKWYTEKHIGKLIFKGADNENWITWDGASGGNTRLFGTETYDNIQCKAYIGLSNYFVSSSTSIWGTDSEAISINNTGNQHIRIRISKTIANDTMALKTWLSTHNTIVYYVLNTPTYTEITDTELISQLNALQLLNGLNNISISSGDLPGEITIHYNYLDAASESIRYVDYLVPNNIVVANTPQGEQAFRITNVEKTKRKIKIKAYHVFYDTENYLIQDSYVVDKNCNDALDHLNNATDNTSPFTTISNITTIDSYRCVRKSLYEAIQVVIERWGGHLVRDNWTIGVYDTIGQDNGVTIRYGKNLKDITASYNWDEVVTKLLPVGKDGILLNALDPTASVYVESTIQYDIPYTKTISFNQDNVNEDDYKDEQGNLDEDAYKQALVNDLLEQGQNYIAINCIPKVNYTLDANVEKISDIGDSIEVIDEKLGINIMTNIISYDYNCILNKYTQLEFGNFTPELKNLMTTINEATEKIIEEQNSTLAITLNQELNEATSKIWNALGNSYVIYDGDKILIVDSLPKETATNVIMINNGGIGFSQTGITGTFQSAWTIDNVLNMEQINVINLTADLIKGGTLKLGSNLNQNGKLEVYDESNTLIAELNKNGLKMYGADGSYVLLNNSVGFAGYDRNNNPNFWVNRDEFHMRKAFAEEEITLVNKMRIIPITLYNNGTLVNDGIGFINVAGGGN